MEKTSLYRIRDAAINSRRAVFSAQQLSNLTGRPRPIAKVYLSRLVKAQLAQRLVRGKISFVDDNYVEATQMIEPSYVSLDSALLFHGIIQQIQASVECVTPINSIRFKSLGIIYHKVPKSLFFGYSRHERMGSYVFVAELEKAFIDGLYLNRYGLSDLLEHASSLDIRKLATLSTRFDGRGSHKIIRVVKSLQKRN